MTQPIVIMGAMPQELEAYHAHFNGRDGVQIVETGVGKVNCAAATARAIERYHPCAMIFTGVAGALEASLQQGDVTVVIGAVDVDVDATAFDERLQRGQLPFTKNRIHMSNRRLVERAFSYEFGVLTPAYAATSDTFRSARNKKNFAWQRDTLREPVPYNAPCFPNICDMETSAFLQTANNAGVPALAIRAISDTFDGDARDEFEVFLQRAVTHYVGIAEHIINDIHKLSKK